MTRFVLDTNVYIRASRDRGARAAFEAFHDVAFARLDFAATVWLELEAGVRQLALRRALEQLVAPFLERENRLLAPSAQAMQQAGRVLATLAMHEGLNVGRAPASFHHDVLLAATVREHGSTLVTENADDFARIQRHLRGFRFHAPYPAGR